MGAQDNQPDWDKMGEKFDMWVPHLAPVGDAILGVLDAHPGQRVLDVACGTGEPALTLARRMGDAVHITAVDAADGMVRIARKKAVLENLNIDFHTMPAENLGFPDASFDRIMSRFGVMLFADPQQGLNEMSRVLSNDGRFALAVWSTAETMPTMHWSYKVIAPRLAEDLHPPLAKITSLSGPGVLEDLLYKAGFGDFDIERKEFSYTFDSFDHYWDTVEASDVLKAQFDALPASERANIRDEVGRLARDFIKDGQFAVPHEYLLAYGRR
jgi:SAM-dependent methyltransferase